MVKFHAGLSDRTVYWRYFCSLSLAARTAHERLVRICFADPGRETVLVATHKDEPTGEQCLVAVGSLVSDEYQGRGLGSKLLRRLIQIAHDQKLDRIVAEMLRDNTIMQAVLKKSGFRLRLFDDPRSVRAVLEL